ncbi:MAG: ubiquinone biosynthesis protein [Fusobacteriaceae bacterium]|nr:ubiB [Fusobacteriales bacterium]MDN5305077.1 ubiquinone biosynthesis protein [Fusobacteriaceae bacterium]
MKISQHFALRIDFLKPEICTELTKLFTNTKKIDNKTFNNLIALYTDENWLKNFDYIEKEPFASASIGQVYNATYKSQDVVVKIINKDSIGDFDKDLIKIKKFFNFILFIYPKLEKVFDPIGILDYIKEYTLEELNLLNEIKGNKILKDIYEKNKRDYDLNNLKFNTFYPELSNENVLVSKKINGHTFDELLSSNKLKYSTLLKFFKIHGFYLFGPGIFHGDIHPGNIILDDNENIYFIDTGAISNVGEKIKKRIILFF